MATPVIHLVMMETLTMAATMAVIVDILLLQMRLGTMLERRNRRKGGYSSDAVETFSYGPALEVIPLDFARMGKDRLGDMNFAYIRT